MEKQDLEHQQTSVEKHFLLEEEDNNDLHHNAILTASETQLPPLDLSRKRIFAIVTLITLITLSLSYSFIPPMFYTYSHKPLKNTCQAHARIEFRSLPPHRRHAYLASVHRLSTLPSRLGLSTSLYDDFTYVHIRLKNSIHHAALSLPWHRYFLFIYEKTLREEGEWEGTLPYWDWTIDAGLEHGPQGSEIWDSWMGFGGDGYGTEKCVNDSILGRMQVAYKEEGHEPHCVTRNFNRSEADGDMFSKQWRRAVVREIVDGSETYTEFRERLEHGPHKWLHRGIGGEMMGITSTNDPLFFVHHAHIDRLWWIWQQRNPYVRNQEFFGPVGLENGTVRETGASLEDEIAMLGLADETKVRDMMTTQNSVLCYKYDSEL